MVKASKKIPKDGQAALDAAVKYEKKMAKLILDLFKKAQKLSAKKLEGFSEGDWERLTKADEPVLTSLESLYLDVATTSAQTLTISLPESFVVKSPTAIKFAQESAATLIKNISSEAQASIRQIIANAQIQGITGRNQAIQIRQFIGLTQRQVNSIANLTNSLEGISAMPRGAQIMRLAQLGESFPLSQVRNRVLSDQAIQRIVSDYANRQLRYRATMIARTETMMAANAGREMTWLELQKQGLVPDSAVRVWYVTPDERTCSQCQALHLTETKLSESAQIPPLHPQCRCVILLEYKRG